MEVDRDSAGTLTSTYSANSGQTVKLRPEDVLHIPGLGFDGIMGYSPIALEKNAMQQRQRSRPRMVARHSFQRPRREGEDKLKPRDLLWIWRLRRLFHAQSLRGKR